MIRYITEIRSMRDFPAWGQARDVIDEIETAGRMDELDEYIELLNGENPMTKGEINDLLSYNWTEVFEKIGMKDWL